MLRTSRLHAIGWRLLLPLLALSVLVLAACTSRESADGGGEQSPPPATDTAKSDPTERADAQVLRVRLSGEPQTLDPQRATDGASLSVIRNLHATLLRLDERQDVQPDLASEVPTLENGGISADGLTYTFKLRDGLRWSDGEPLVAQQFVDAARRLFEPGSANFYVDFYRVLAADGNNLLLLQALGDGADDDSIAQLEQAVVASLAVSAPDDQTVVYTLNRQSPIFVLLATMWPLSPVRQDVIDAYGDGWTEPGRLVSSGPLVLAEWNHEQDLTLVANEYWHREGPILDEVRFDIIGDDALAFLAYQAGELDITRIGPAELVQVRGTELEDQFNHYAQLSTVGFYFNFDDPALSSLAVRQSLTGAYDREEYAEIVLEGGVLAAYGWLPPGMPGYQAGAGEQYRDALDRSRALLVQAGYPGGEGLSIEVLTPNTSGTIARAEWLQEQWSKNLGIEVTVNVAEIPAYVQARGTGDYQVAIGGWAADYPDPQNWLPPFRTGGALNSGNFSSADFDALIDAAESELDLPTRLWLYQQAELILLEEAGFAPLFHGRRNVLVQPWVQGLVLSSMEHESPGDLFFDRVFISGRGATTAQR